MPQQVTTKEDALGVNAGGIEQRQAKAITPAVAANETTVSATLVDLGGTIWQKAVIIINFVPAPNIPGPYMWGGGPFSLNPRITSNSSGFFSITLPDNTTITPAGSTWQFVIAPNATMPAVIFNIMVAGSSMDISSIFTAQSYQVSLGMVQSLPMPRAYSDSEVATPPNAGQMYYNATDHELKVFISGSWFGLLGGGWHQVQDNTDANTVNGSYLIAPNGFVNGPPTTPTTNQILSQFGSMQFCFSADNNSGTNSIYVRRYLRSASPYWTPWEQLLSAVVFDNPIDFNNLISTCTYVLYGGASANGPSIITNSAFALLEVFQMPGPTFYQRLVCPVDPTYFSSIFHRVYNGAWSSWYQLVGTAV